MALPKTGTDSNKKYNGYKGIYENCDEDSLVFFDLHMLAEIEELAIGLSEAEVLDYYALTMDDLHTAEKMKSEDDSFDVDDITTAKYDLRWFYISFKRGRTKAKKIACDRLFQNMTNRSGGTQAAVIYLKHFADKFPLNVDDSELNMANKNFSFTVVMD